MGGFSQRENEKLLEKIVDVQGVYLYDNDETFKTEFCKFELETECSDISQSMKLLKLITDILDKDHSIEVLEGKAKGVDKIDFTVRAGNQEQVETLLSDIIQQHRENRPEVPNVNWDLY